MIYHIITFGENITYTVRIVVKRSELFLI